MLTVYSKRDAQFEEWANKPNQGVGIRHFQDFKKGNSFVHKKNTLSSSEWTAAIKMNSNYANLRAMPSAKKSAQNILCRHGCRENQIETIPHVLGYCKRTEYRRNQRHHAAKRQIASLLKEKGYQCYDEVKCVDSDGSTRYIDILAFEPNSNRAFIIDPTIRFEANRDVAAEVQADKEKIYTKCIDDVERKFSPLHGSRQYEVIGVWIGSRGTITSSVIEFFDRFGLNKDALVGLAEEVLWHSIRMIHTFIYG